MIIAFHPKAAGGAAASMAVWAATVDGHPPPGLAGGGKPWFFGWRLACSRNSPHRGSCPPPGRNIDPLGQMGADGHETASKPLVARLEHVFHLVVGQRHPGLPTMRATPVQHVAGQAVGGNTTTGMPPASGPPRGSHLMA